MKNNNFLKKINENRFLIVGRAGVDIYPDPPGTKTENATHFVTHLGGSSANIAVALTKLQGNCKILTSVSDDALGRLAINQLNSYNVDTSLISFKKEESRISFAVVESRIEDHQSIIYRNKASDLLMNDHDVDKVNIEDFSCLIVTGTCLASDPSRAATFKIIEKAKLHYIPVILDLDYRPYTWNSSKEASDVYLRASKSCDILIGNDNEFGVLANDYNKGINIAKELSNKVSIVIYKKGEKGSITFYDNKQINKGIFIVNALKPTGAGDAFMGSFIGALLNDKNIESSIEYGSASAAIVVTKVGCAPAMPLLDEIEEFMKLNKMNKY
jgi:5-dehydro-2-deoxygluconokinase